MSDYKIIVKVTHHYATESDARFQYAEWQGQGVDCELVVTTQAERQPLDVWFLFDEPDDEEPSHEANTFLTDDKTFRVEWSNVSVGQITAREFDTYAEASAWLEASDYRDFSS